MGVTHMKSDVKDSFFKTKCGTYSSFLSTPKASDDWNRVNCNRCLHMRELEHNGTRRKWGPVREKT